MPITSRCRRRAYTAGTKDRMLTHRAASCVVALLALSHGAQADVTGPATIIDGDTIVVAGERIRLQGIDAPELQQTCTAYGQPWACG